MEISFFSEKKFELDAVQIEEMIILTMICGAFLWGLGGKLLLVYKNMHLVHQDQQKSEFCFPKHY